MVSKISALKNNNLLTWRRRSEWKATWLASHCWTVIFSGLRYPTYLPTTLSSRDAGGDPRLAPLGPHEMLAERLLARVKQTRPQCESFFRVRTFSNRLQVFAAWRRNS